MRAVNDERRHINTALLVCLLVTLVLAWMVFRYFILTFVIAAAVAMLLAPLQERATARLRGRSGLAAGMITVLCTLMILIPVLSYGVLLSRQAVGFADWLTPRIEPAALDQFARGPLAHKHPLIAKYLARSAGGDVTAAVSMWLGRLTSFLNHLAQEVLTSLATAVMDTLLFLMMLFFLLRDGALIRDHLRGISPFTRSQESELLDHLTGTVKGTLLSIVAVPVAQGLASLVGFVAFGLPSPLLWAVMVVFGALIPLVGSPIVWVPAGLYLLANDATGRGIGLLIYGALVISMVDNVLKPIILRSAAQIHTLLGFLAIFGGMQAFGPKGMIVGPVILSLVITAYRIYRFDILRWRRESEGGPAPPREVAAAL